ncbi:SDR family NAD(P)-dependent oxidoreductase [Rhodococcus sp. NPDC057529]|uniref:SDR family NAD(P)-dependent oxidoreductase n=1 Tax=Rhodococcus sp. NPDC057529 TaxID=3346158 RepID=UPI00366AE8AB
MNDMPNRPPHMGLDFTGQHVVIIGAGGIGYETARICAANGARLSIIDIADKSETPRANLVDADRHSWLKMDVTETASQLRIGELLEDADALIITSAYFPDEPALELMSDEWFTTFRRVMDVNIGATMRLSQLAVAAMAARGGGRIVILGSVAGRMGGLLSGALYASSKGAVHTFTRWLSLRAAPRGVNVNCLAPGVTDTPMIAGRPPADTSRIPAGRIAQPNEIAPAVAFLASPAAGYIHGQVIDVNGGIWMS